jgi:tetratricopeptide (TPR) repeat protein
MRALTLGTGLLAFATLASSLRAQGEPRVPELLAAADQAWSAARYDDALRGYSEVLRRDSTSARAVFRVATLFAWRNDLDHSIALFRKYSTLAPSDADGRVGLARALAWRGDLSQAQAICDSVLAGNPDNREAALLTAQTEAWSGRLEVAAEHYERWLARHPDDADGWNALAQVWRWSGRSDRAREALRHALAADPTNATALAQLPWTEVALSPSIEPAVTSTDDSDNNRTLTYVVRAGFAAPWSARVQTNASYRAADLGVAHGTSASVLASSSWTPLDGSWTVRGEVGAAQLEGSDGSTTSRNHFEPLASARLSGRVTPHLTLGASASHAAFDETAALIFSGIASSSLDGDADITLRPRLSLGGGGGWTRLSGGASPNSRLAGSGALRWAVSKALSVALGARGFGYDHAAFDGYFAPKRYLLAEGSARLHLGGDLGWALDSELGLGDQRITAFDDSNMARFAQRCTAAVAYRPAPGVEWSLGGSFANVASPTTISSADYRAYSLSVKGRLRL